MFGVWIVHSTVLALIWQLRLDRTALDRLGIIFIPISSTDYKLVYPKEEEEKNNGPYVLSPEYLFSVFWIEKRPTSPAHGKAGHQFRPFIFYPYFIQEGINQRC